MSEMERPADDFRGWAREQWGELGEKAGRVLSIALDANKTIRRTITCSKCGTRQQKDIQIGDARIALDALEWLTSSGFGRSPVASEESRESFSFVNRIVLVSDEDEETALPDTE